MASRGQPVWRLRAKGETAARLPPDCSPLVLVPRAHWLHDLGNAAHLEPPAHLRATPRESMADSLPEAFGTVYGPFVRPTARLRSLLRFAPTRAGLLSHRFRHSNRPAACRDHYPPRPLDG